MRCPQPLDRRPAADLAGRQSRTAADGPGDEAKSSAPLRNSSPQRQVGTCAGSLVSTKSISTGRCEADRRGAGSGLRRDRARAGWPVPADGPPILRSDPFLRLLPCGRDIDREADRSEGTADPAAFCSQEARRAPPPHRESSLRLPLDGAPDGRKPTAGQLAALPPEPSSCRIAEKPPEKATPSGARCRFSTAMISRWARGLGSMTQERRCL